MPRNVGSTRSLAAALALALGVLVAAGPAGAQSGEGEPCGGVGGPVCAIGFFCDSESAQCKEDAPEGTCIRRTEACTRIYQPVCGCDGKTYANDCERIRAAARKDHDDRCSG